MLGGERGVDDTGEVEDCGPLAVALGLPDDLSVEEGGGFGLRNATERLRLLGNDPRPTSPEEFKARMAADIAKWTAVVDGANFERI